MQLTDKVTVVGQADLTGLLAGQLAHDTWADPTPRDSFDGYSNLQPRWLYADWLSPVGLVRAGQQPSHWGMGLVANDGDHPSLFGDYRLGNIVEQVLFATKPLGRDRPFFVALAGNLVYRDNYATLANGDRAWQGIVAAFYQQGQDLLGVYGVYRSQRRDQSSMATYYPYEDELDVGVLDAAGRFARPLALPDDRAYVFGSFEAAVELEVDQRGAHHLRARERVPDADPGLRRRGDAGARARGPSRSRPSRARLARRAARLCGGAWWPSSRSGTRPVTPTLTTTPRSASSSIRTTRSASCSSTRSCDGRRRARRWPRRIRTCRTRSAARRGRTSLLSGAGVFGAEYVYPTFVVRPRRWLDLKAGAVIAQTTADYVDPYRLAVNGVYVNYAGGPAQRHDLGVELDGGFEARVPLERGMTLQLGGQAGVLAPGGALADAAGMTLPAPWVAIARVGLEF